MESDKKKEEEREVKDKKEPGGEKSNNKSSFLQGVLGEEVTWTAVAAIGGAIIVIWNIIRYVFTFYSSMIMYTITHVPPYILMKRHNQPFTDINLLVCTFLFMVVIISFTKYNPILHKNEKKVDKMTKYFSIVVGIDLVITLLIWIKYKEYPDTKYLIGLHWNQFLSYSYPFLLVPHVLWFGKSYVLSKDKYKSISKELDKDRKERIKKWKQEHSFPEEYDEYYQEQKDIFSARISVFGVFRYLFFGLSLLIVVATSTIPFEYYIDQNNRIIIADLGEQYIVQDAKYNQEKQEIIIDISHYSVIDSSDESIREAKAVYRYTMDGFQ